MDEKIFKQIDERIKTDGEKNVLNALRKNPRLMIKCVNLQQKIFNSCCNQCRNALLKNQSIDVLCQECREKNKESFEKLEDIRDKLQK